MIDDTRPATTPSVTPSTIPSPLSHPPSTSSPDSETTLRSPLTPNLVSTLQVAAVHRVHSKPISSTDFSSDGATLASCSHNGLIALYNTLDGIHTASIPVLKYGASLLRFIAHQNSHALITASTHHDNNLRLLDLESERYVRYFTGHDAPVSALAASPVSSAILSAGKDAWIRAWDVRVERALAKVKAVGSPLVAYDPKGLIFSVAYNAPDLKTTLVKLYDARQYDEGPFLEFPLDNPADAAPSCLRFSSDGEYFLLVNAEVNATVAVYDAYQGKPFRTFTGHQNASGIALEASFSPDSAFVASGSDDGSLLVWHVESERLLVDRKEVHAMPSTCVMWNPVYQMLTSACQNMLFWLPQGEDSSSSY